MKQDSATFTTVCVSWKNNRVGKETIMKKLMFLAVVLIGAAAVAQNFAFAQYKDKGPAKPDPWAGSWKFDAAKSKLHGPAPKEETATSQPNRPHRNTVNYAINGTPADRKPITESY